MCCLCFLLSAPPPVYAVAFLWRLLLVLPPLSAFLPGQARRLRHRALDALMGSSASTFHTLHPCMQYADGRVFTAGDCTVRTRNRSAYDSTQEQCVWVKVRPPGGEDRVMAYAHSPCKRNSLACATLSLFIHRTLHLTSS